MLTLLRWGMKLLLLCVFLLAVLWFTAGVAAKYLIEKRGPAILGAHVSVGSVSLALASGEAVVTNLAVGNPPGFSAAPAFKLDRLRVVVDLPSLTGSPVRLREITVSGADLRVEAGKGGVNLLTLAKHARGERKPSSPADRLYVLDRFEFAGGRIEASVAVPGLPERGKADLPPVRLTDVGRKSGGETLRELVASLVESVAREAATPDRVGRLEDKLKDVFEDRLKRERDKVGDRLKGLFK